MNLSDLVANLAPVRAIGMAELNTLQSGESLIAETDDPRTPESFMLLNEPAAFFGNDGSISVISGRINISFDDCAIPLSAGGHVRTPKAFAAHPEDGALVKFIGKADRADLRAVPELRPHRFAPRLVRASEEAFYVTNPLHSIWKAELQLLRDEVVTTSRQRVRICCHANMSATLHEMFVCYTKSVNIAPHKHLAKDESFHVLEGALDLIFYNGTGDVTQIVPMGDQSSGLPFYYRVPRDTYHAVAVSSDYCILHEGTAGPFDRAHTVWANEGWIRHPEKKWI